MRNWQVLSFETTLESPNAIPHPPIIEAAQNVGIPNGSSPEFCILMRFRTEGDRVFRDYYFSPTAIILCGPILAHGNGVGCEKPSGSGLDLVAGDCTFFVAETRPSS